MFYSFLCTLCFWMCIYSSSSQNVVNFKITEQQAARIKVGNIGSEIKINVTSEVNGSLRYTYLENDHITSLFTLNNRTGSLETASVIDREKVCDNPICVLSFDVAVRSTKTDMFLLVTVKITVEDLNDNSPKFPDPVLDFPISESAANNSKYPLPVAVDADTSSNFSIQSYEISPPSDTFGLIVGKRFDGSLYVELVLKKKLDREIKSYYQIFVLAKDGGNPPQTGKLTLNIPVLDANDNQPVFSQQIYNVTIKETTDINTSVVQVTATDADSGENGRVSYSISPGQTDKATINSLFRIDITTGKIFLLQKLVYEPGKIYEIFVDASDHGERPMVAQAKVIIQVEDAGNNKPVIKINLLSAGTNGVQVSEAANIDGFVAHVNVEDSDIGDNGKVVCNIKQDLSYNFFKVEKLENGKGFKVVIKQKLNYEGLKMHNVTVVCHDFGNPPLSSSESFTVYVTDDNDNKPIFEKSLYIANIEENNHIGDRILQVSATDKDSGVNKQIQYFLQSDAGSRFAINSDSGVITARAVYNRERHESYKFHVIAVDNGDPPQTGTAVILLNIDDKNDNKPKFNETIFTFEVLENLGADTLVGRVYANDSDKGDNANIVYSIAAEDKFLVPFVVFPDGSIRTNRELDREYQSQYNFVVYATDKGTPSLNSTTYVTVYVIDANDNDPIIIFPNKRNNTISSSITSLPIATIQAYDIDEGINKRLNYYIQEGNANKLFIINVQSGEIFLNPSYHITSDMSTSLVICVKDSGNPTRSKCTQLNAIITINNATLQAHQQSDVPNKYIIISIVVVIVTILVSVAIIGTIFFLRKMDQNRQKQKFQNSGPLGVPTMQNGYVQGHSCSSSYSESETNSTGELMDKKKKEVSFSPSTNFEDNNMKNALKEINLHLNPNSSESSYLYDKAAGSSHNSPIDSIHLQQVQEPPPSYHMVLHPGDNHSDTSGETTSSDSGRGGSENEVPNSSQITEDRSFEYPSQSFSCLQNSSYPSTSSSSYHSSSSPRKDKSYSSQQKFHLNRSFPNTNSVISDKRHSSHSFSSNQKQPYVHPHRSSVQNFSDNYLKSTNLNAWSFLQQQDPSRYSGIDKDRDYFHLRPDSLNTLRSREDDDDAATTTSGSYTLDHEEIDQELYPAQQKDLVV